MNILLSQSNEHLPISGLNFQFLLERGIFYYSYFSNKETKLQLNFISWEETPKKPVCTYSIQGTFCASEEKQQQLPIG